MGYLRKRKLIFWIKFWAIFDIIFCDRWELKARNTYGLYNQTKFDKNEILNSKL